MDLPQQIGQPHGQRLIGPGLIPGGLGLGQPLQVGLPLGLRPHRVPDAVDLTRDRGLPLAQVGQFSVPFLGHNRLRQPRKLVPVGRRARHRRFQRCDLALQGVALPAQGVLAGLRLLGGCQLPVLGLAGLQGGFQRLFGLGRGFLGVMQIRCQFGRLQDLPFCSGGSAVGALDLPVQIDPFPREHGQSILARRCAGLLLGVVRRKGGDLDPQVRDGRAGQFLQLRQPVKGGPALRQFPLTRRQRGQRLGELAPALPDLGRFGLPGRQRPDLARHVRQFPGQRLGIARRAGRLSGVGRAQAGQVDHRLLHPDRVVARGLGLLGGAGGCGFDELLRLGRQHRGVHEHALDQLVRR